VFTKVILPPATFHFLENRPAPVLGNMAYSRTTHIDNSPWIALALVLCAHLAVFAALHSQSQPIPAETIPEPIMISLLTEPQAAPQQPAPPPVSIEKPQKTIKKPVKAPISKPVKPVIKQTGEPIALPVEQTALSAAPVSVPAAAEPATRQTTKTDDTQTFQSPSFNAEYLNNPAPNYPSISRRLGEEGLVLLHVQVTEDGTADSVALQTSSGSDRLDQAALEAVKKWQFVPAKRGEQSVSASVVVPVRFSIEG
jgi:protein TonB